MTLGAYDLLELIRAETTTVCNVCDGLRSKDLESEPGKKDNSNLYMCLIVSQVSVCFIPLYPFTEGSLNNHQHQCLPCFLCESWSS